jgi:dUTP pyrophosphatase
MKSVARFEKVSFEQFLKDFKDTYPIDDAIIKKIYDNIKLPKRATVGSAGYDFYAPVEIRLNPGETAKIPTGIRSYIENGYVLEIYPRSGLGFKYRLQLNNTVGIIDSDYYNNEDNEGHIMFQVYNFTDKEVLIPTGERIGQGIFLQYGKVDGDNASGNRIGGFGSTSI